MPRGSSSFPRYRQACRRERRGSADAASAGAGVGQGPSAAVDPRLRFNRVFLSGILAGDPQRDRDRNGEPVLLLRVAFPAPDTRETRPGVEAALEEIEVPAEVAERHGKELRVGNSIFVTGQLSGGGGVIAIQIHSGPPPDQEAGPDGPPGRKSP